MDKWLFSDSLKEWFLQNTMLLERSSMHTRGEPMGSTLGYQAAPTSSVVNKWILCNVFIKSLNWFDIT